MKNSKLSCNIKVKGMFHQQMALIFSQKYDMQLEFSCLLFTQFHMGNFFILYSLNKTFQQISNFKMGGNKAVVNPGLEVSHAEF